MVRLQFRALGHGGGAVELPAAATVGELRSAVQSALFTSQQELELNDMQSSTAQGTDDGQGSVVENAEQNVLPLRLIFGGRVLRDDAETLESRGLDRDDLVVHAVIQKPPAVTSSQSQQQEQQRQPQQEQQERGSPQGPSVAALPQPQQQQGAVQFLVGSIDASGENAGNIGSLIGSMINSVLSMQQQQQQQQQQQTEGQTPPPVAAAAAGAAASSAGAPGSLPNATEQSLEAIADILGVTLSEASSGNSVMQLGELLSGASSAAAGLGTYDSPSNVLAQQLASTHGTNIPISDVLSSARQLAPALGSLGLALQALAMGLMNLRTTTVDGDDMNALTVSALPSIGALRAQQATFGGNASANQANFGHTSIPVVTVRRQPDADGTASSVAPVTEGVGATPTGHAGSLRSLNAPAVVSLLGQLAGAISTDQSSADANPGAPGITNELSSMLQSFAAQASQGGVNVAGIDASQIFQTVLPFLQNASQIASGSSNAVSSSTSGTQTTGRFASMPVYSGAPEQDPAAAPVADHASREVWTRFLSEVWGPLQARDVAEAMANSGGPLLRRRARLRVYMMERQLEISVRSKFPLFPGLEQFDPASATGRAVASLPLSQFADANSLALKWRRMAERHADYIGRFFDRFFVPNGLPLRRGYEATPCVLSKFVSARWAALCEGLLSTPRQLPDADFEKLVQAELQHTAYGIVTLIDAAVPRSDAVHVIVDSLCRRELSMFLDSLDASVGDFPVAPTLASILAQTGAAVGPGNDGVLAALVESGARSLAARYQWASSSEVIPDSWSRVLFVDDLRQRYEREHAVPTTTGKTLSTGRSARIANERFPARMRRSASASISSERTELALLSASLGRHSSGDRATLSVNELSAIPAALRVRLYDRMRCDIAKAVNDNADARALAFEGTLQARFPEATRLIGDTMSDE